MTTVRGFRTRLGGVAPKALNEQLYRSVLITYATSPLSGFGSTQRGGRYNRKKTFEAYYLSASPKTALLEAGAVASTPGAGTTGTPAPRVLITVLAKLSRTLDLRDRAVRRSLGVTKADLLAPWLIDQNRGRFPTTQRIGQAAHDERFEGILAPSDADPHGWNLVIIYAALLQTSSLTVIGGIHRPGGLGINVIRGRLAAS